MEGRRGVEVRRSCAAKRRRQQRADGSWQKRKIVANEEFGEAKGRHLFGDAAS